MNLRNDWMELESDNHGEKGKMVVGCVRGTERGREGERERGREGERERRTEGKMDRCTDVEI